MFVKKFEALSLEEALQQVKVEFGPNALILSTHEKKGNWYQKKRIEVTAAREKEPEPVEARYDEEALKQVFPHRRTPPPPEEKKTNRYSAEEPEKSVPERSKAKGKERSSLLLANRYEQDFVKRGFSVETAKDLSRRLVFEYSSRDLSDLDFLAKAKARFLTPALNTLSRSSFDSPASWFFVGLPGSGKTSLIAKLGLSLKNGREQVQVVSVDQRKVSGRSELAAYAKLMGISFAPEIQEGGRCLSLIDTPSLNFNESALKTLEEKGRGHRTVLVLDASQRMTEWQRVIDSVHPLSPVAVAVTKCDLVSGPGMIYDLLRHTKLPLVGVSVSDSFKIPFRFFEPSELAMFLIGEEFHENA